MKHILLVTISILGVGVADNIDDIAGVDSTLKLVHVIFRHGDRTPDSLYPNDPYTEEDFYPFRIGHLTNNGKMTAYKIGTSLRKKYNKLLGDVYTPDILNAISSHYPRAKASLQAVLAGLYPPSDSLKWNKNLSWEPIPFDALQADNNKMFVSFKLCPGTLNLLLQSATAMASDPVFLKYKHFEPMLQEATGMHDYPLLLIGTLVYSTLKAEDEAGLKLPSWTKDVYPEVLSEISAAFWKYTAAEGDMRILSAGYLVSQIVNNTYTTINGEEDAKNRKIYLYSGHDYNVVALLSVLENLVPHNPNYGAHIIIEVHEFMGAYFLKFLHQNYERSEPKTLFVPNCGYYCPLELFVKLYAKYLDTNYMDELCGLN
ncbi:venom acid phosphatase Acph-1-like [Onthophagus taurus]|uniref:venom acid phosphatase Acph-1-like n=1 Tax=Onthophagus taurus TaxID=166361 RepID=UPI0039BE9BFE